MTKELRTIKKAVKDYSNLLNNDKENAVKYCDDYIKDVNILIEFLEVFIDETADVFKHWCNISVAVFEWPEDNIFKSVYKSLNMMVANHYLNKFSFDLSSAGKFKTQLEKVKIRLEQFKYLL